MNQKFLRLVLTASASVLLSVLVVFVVVNAQSFLRQDALVVEGTATIEQGSYFNTLGADNGLIIVGREDNTGGNVGIGTKFADENPVSKLDVDGWVRASGARFDTVIVDGALGIGVTPSSNDAFRVQTVGSLGSVINSVTVSSNGYVGIWNTNPSAPLDVSGRIKIDCSICLGWADRNGSSPERQQCYNLNNVGRTNGQFLQLGGDVGSDDRLWLWMQCP